MSAVRPPTLLSQSGPDGHAEPMNFMVQVLFLAHHLLGDPAEDFSDWGHGLCQSSLDMILSQLRMESGGPGPVPPHIQELLVMCGKAVHAVRMISQAGGCWTPFYFCMGAFLRSENEDSESPPVYEYSNVALMTNNGDLDFLDEREEEMQAFLVAGIGQLMALRNRPEAFEIVRQALIACDRFALRTQVQVEWTSPFELLEQLPVDSLILADLEPVLRCDSPEYACWAGLVLRAGNTRHVAKVLRSMIGSCCSTGDCVDSRMSLKVCEA